MTIGLTGKQQAVLEAVRAYWRQHGVPPALVNLASALGLSLPTVHQHLLALERKGYLEHINRSGRTWRPKDFSPPVEPPIPEPTSAHAPLAKSTKALRLVPVVGRVGASPPSLAVEDQLGAIPVEGFREDEEVFGLRVTGDSMEGARIFDGDVVVVRRQGTAENGDIVVVLVDDEDATVKRFKPIRNGVKLVAENPDCPSKWYRGDRVQVLGKVMEVRRRLGK